MNTPKTLAAISLVLAMPFLAAQGLSPDEVKVTSRPYAPQAQSVFRVDTKSVDIGVVVRDSHGRAISGLTKDNFQIHDNGKEREIGSFAVDSSAGPAAQATAPQASPSLPEPVEKSDAPAKSAPSRQQFIALYIDDVNAKDGQHLNDLKQTQDAAQKFVKEALKPEVQIGIFTASGAQTLDFTTDVAKLIETIGNVRAHARLSESGCPAPYLAYLIVVRNDRQALNELMAPRDLDSKAQVRQCRISGIQQAEETWRQARQISADTLDSIGHVADRLGKMPGTRVLLLASSGFLTATLEQQRDQIVNNALRAGVVINALDSKGLYEWLEANTKDVALTQMFGISTVKAGVEHNNFETTQMGLRLETMNEPLAALAEGTGGNFFHNSNDLTAGFLELEDPPEAVYRLSLRPQDVPADGTYHKLKVTVLRAPHKSVQARPGYFAPAAKSEPDPVVESSRFDREVMATDTIEDFPVDVSAQLGKPSGGTTTLVVLANVDISKLNFAKQGDRRKQTIRFVSALINAEGAIVIAKEATMELSLKEATYNRLAKTGLNAKLALQAPPGVYSVREVVEETAERKLACSTHSIEIP